MAQLMVGLTAAACVAALVFRTPLRSRYWAWRIVQNGDPAERAIYLTALCNAGDGGRWGTAALLGHEAAEIRQLGAVVLQHVRTAWGRGRLLRALEDPDQNVRELAALGLAMHGDASVIPTLKQMYLTGDRAAAVTACLALERLAAPGGVVAALTELTREAADVTRRAALVDALAGIGQPACVPPLIQLLADHRACATPPRSARVAQGVLKELAATGQLGAAVSSLQTPSVAPTIAERAAAALARITGVDPQFSSAMSPVEQQRAVQQWSDWRARQVGPP